MVVSLKQGSAPLLPGRVVRTEVGIITRNANINNTNDPNTKRRPTARPTPKYSTMLRQPLRLHLSKRSELASAPRLLHAKIHPRPCSRQKRPSILLIMTMFAVVLEDTTLPVPTRQPRVRGQVPRFTSMVRRAPFGSINVPSIILPFLFGNGVQVTVAQAFFPAEHPPTGLSFRPKLLQSARGTRASMPLVSR